jgi:hypothetical protein
MLDTDSTYALVSYAHRFSLERGDQYLYRAVLLYVSKFSQGTLSMNVNNFHYGANMK